MTLSRQSVHFQIVCSCHCMTSYKSRHSGGLYLGRCVYQDHVCPLPRGRVARAKQAKRLRLPGGFISPSGATGCAKIRRESPCRIDLQKLRHIPYHSILRCKKIWRVKSLSLPMDGCSFPRRVGQCEIPGHSDNTCSQGQLWQCLRPRVMRIYLAG